MATPALGTTRVAEELACRPWPREVYRTAGRTELCCGVLVSVLLWGLLKLPQTPSFLQGWGPLRDCPYLCGARQGGGRESRIKCHVLRYLVSRWYKQAIGILVIWGQLEPVEGAPSPKVL